MYMPCCIYPSVEGHLGCSYLLANMNNAVLNIGVWVFESLVLVLLAIYSVDC